MKSDEKKKKGKEKCLWVGYSSWAASEYSKEFYAFGSPAPTVIRDISPFSSCIFGPIKM